MEIELPQRYNMSWRIITWGLPLGIPSTRTDFLAFLSVKKTSKLGIVRTAFLTVAKKLNLQGHTP